MGRRGAPGPASYHHPRGLAEAVSDARVVVDVANSPSFEDKAVLDSSKDPAATCWPREAPRASDITSRVRRRHRPPAGQRLSTGKLAQRRSSNAPAFPTRFLQARSFFESSRASSRQAPGDSSACHRRSSSRSPPRCAAALADLVWDSLNRTVEVAGPNASGSMRWRGDFWPPPATSVGHRGRDALYSAQTRRHSLTAAIRRGLGRPFRGLARPSGSLATTRPLPDREEEPSKNPSRFIWRANSGFASGGIADARAIRELLRVGLGLKLNQSRSRPSLSARPTHQATDSVTAYAVRSGPCSPRRVFF